MGERTQLGGSVVMILLCAIGCGDGSGAHGDEDVATTADGDELADGDGTVDMDAEDDGEAPPDVEDDGELEFEHRAPTGFSCDCDDLGSPLGDVVISPPSGSFEPVALVAQRARTLVGRAAEEERSAMGSQTPYTVAYVTDDEWPDIIIGYAHETWVIPQSGDGEWGTQTRLLDLVAEGPTRPGWLWGCVAAADIVGDDAWELVCMSPFGWFEGHVGEDGRQRLVLDGEHWHAGFGAGTPMGSLDLSPGGNMVRLRDYDGDGDPEAIVTTFNEDAHDFLLQLQEDGTYSAASFRTGMTFATCDVDLDGDLVPDAVYAFKERAGNDPDNVNAMYRIVSTETGVQLDRYDPLDPTDRDNVGWFGLASDSPHDHTPMGCHGIPWLPGYLITQDDATSLIAYPTGDGTVCDAMVCFPELIGTTRSVVQWAVVFTSWRGRLHEGVIATATEGEGRNLGNVQYVAHLGSDGLRAYNRGDGFELPGLSEPGSYFGALAFDFSGGDGRPDLLTALRVAPQYGENEPVRLFTNALEPIEGEEILCLELLGKGGESATVRFEFGDGQVEEVVVADGGNLGSSAPPVVFQGVTGPADVVVRRPGREPERFEALEPGACYNLRAREPDGLLPGPVRTR